MRALLVIVLATLLSVGFGYDFSWRSHPSTTLKSKFGEKIGDDVAKNIPYHDAEHGTDFADGVKVMSVPIADTMNTAELIAKVSIADWQAFIDGLAFSGSFHDSAYLWALLQNRYTLVSSGGDNGATTNSLKFSQDHEDHSFCKLLDALNELRPSDDLPADAVNYLKSAQNIIVSGYCIFHTKMFKDAEFDIQFNELLQNPAAFFTRYEGAAATAMNESVTNTRYNCPQMKDEAGTLFRDVLKTSKEREIFGKWHELHPVWKDKRDTKLADDLTALSASWDPSQRAELEPLTLNLLSTAKVAGSVCAAADFFAYTQKKGLCRSADCGKEFRAYSGVDRNTGPPGKLAREIPPVDALHKFWAGQEGFMTKAVINAGSFSVAGVPYRPLINATSGDIGLLTLAKIQAQVSTCVSKITDNADAAHQYAICLGISTVKSTPDLPESDKSFGCVADSTRDIPTRPGDDLWKDCFALAAMGPLRVPARGRAQGSLSPLERIVAPREAHEF